MNKLFTCITGTLSNGVIMAVACWLERWSVENLACTFSYSSFDGHTFPVEESKRMGDGFLLVCFPTERLPLFLSSRTLMLFSGLSKCVGVLANQQQSLCGFLAPLRYKHLGFLSTSVDFPFSWPRWSWILMTGQRRQSSGTVSRLFANIPFSAWRRWEMCFSSNAGRD